MGRFKFFLVNLCDQLQGEISHSVFCIQNATIGVMSVHRSALNAHFGRAYLREKRQNSYKSNFLELLCFILSLRIN